MSILLAVIVFVMAVNLSKVYQAETTVLFLPRTEVTARNIDQIIANAKQIPTALSFYDKLVENNPSMNDEASELVDVERKEFWNSKIKISQIGKSGMLAVKTLGDGQINTEALSRRVVSDLLNIMSKYYNIKTDLDIRIVDGPIISQAVRMNISLWIFLSLLFGCVGGFLVSTFFMLLSQADFERTEKFTVEDQSDFEQETNEFPPVSFSETRIENKEALPEIRNIFNFDAEAEVVLAQPKKEEFLGASEKKAAAPDNLPIAEEEFVFAMPTETVSPIEPVAELKEVKPVETMIAEAVAADTTREATPEEVKARLNKLLRGGM